MNPPGRTMTRQPQQPFRSTARGGTCTRIPVKAGTRVIVAAGAMPRAIAHYHSTLLDEICGKSRALGSAIQSLSPRIFFRHAVQGDAVSKRVGQPVTQPVVKYGWVTQQKVNGMVIKLQNKNKSTLTPEGLYPATVKAISVKNKRGTEVPVSVIVEFALGGRTESLLKEYPPSLEEGSPLLQDTYTVLGRCLAPEEVSDGFDPDVLKDRACQVVVGHRVGSDGSFTPYASVVMGAVQMPAN